MNFVFDLACFKMDSSVFSNTVNFSSEIKNTFRQFPDQIALSFNGKGVGRSKAAGSFRPAALTVRTAKGKFKITFTQQKSAVGNITESERTLGDFPGQENVNKAWFPREKVDLNLKENRLGFNEQSKNENRVLV